MARPREFIKETALDKALQVFWSKGYEATSLCDLVAAMGLSKSSFYDTFSSKQDLFLSSIDRYHETTMKQVKDILDGDLPARAAINSIFRMVIEDDDNRGCFLGNCAVEINRRDDDAKRRIKAAMKALETAFADTVKRGQDAGEISKALDPQAAGRFLASNINGLRVLSKTGVDRQHKEDVFKMVMLTLR